MDINSKGIRIAPFVLGILCFLLPFIEVSCSGQKLASFTGLQLITGSELQSPMGGEPQKYGLEPFALISMLCFVAGVVFALQVSKYVARNMVIISSASLISMFILKVRIDGAITKNSASIPITVNYLSGYWLACISGISGLLLGLYLLKIIPAIEISGIKKIFEPDINNENGEPVLPERKTEGMASLQVFNAADMLSGIKKYKMPLAALLIGVALIFGGYKLFFEHDPVKDAKKAAIALFENSKKDTELRISRYKDFLNSFDKKKFVRGNDAREKFDTLINDINKECDLRFAKIVENNMRTKSIYIGNKEIIDLYEQSFIAQQGMLSNPAADEVSVLYSQIDNKINALENNYIISKMNVGSMDIRGIDAYGNIEPPPAVPEGYRADVGRIRVGFQNLQLLATVSGPDGTLCSFLWNKDGQEIRRSTATLPFINRMITDNISYNFQPGHYEVQVSVNNIVVGSKKFDVF